MSRGIFLLELLRDISAFIASVLFLAGASVAKKGGNDEAVINLYLSCAIAFVFCSLVGIPATILNYRLKN